MDRLFIALRPPPDVRDALLETQGGVENARWQSDDQVHLTLRFLGEVDRRTVAEIESALDTIVEDCFPLRVSGVGHFEQRGRASALWAGVAPSAELHALQQSVERACRATGLRAEPRRFVPHITIARLGSGAVGAGDWLARHGDLSSAPWPVASFRLYSSTLSPAGARYTALAEWPLMPAANAGRPTSD